MWNPGPCRVPFHKQTSVALTAGTAQFAVSPAGGVLGATNDLANAFNQYRIEELKFRIIPFAAAGIQTAAYYPETTVAVTTAGGNSECIDSCLISQLYSVPSEWCVVPKHRLRGQLDWYKCVADASAGEFENQGVFVVTGTTTEVFVLEVRGVIALRDPTDASVQLQRARETLLQPTRRP